jgi:phosphatidylglycerol---prolipoprotein diacylglyceryl transferase
MSFMLAWLYWNPERVVFTVPIIDRPVVSYGLWFVFGFIFGYFALIPIFKRRLSATKTMAERDIANWQALFHRLQHADNPITPKLDSSTRHALIRLSNHNQPSASQKAAILTAINAALADPSLKLDRTKLQALFPNAFYSLRNLAQFLVDRLTWFAVLGTIIGARLGHVFFYEWPYYQHHLWKILEVWNGGLASHGGTIGIMIAIFIYQRTIYNRFPEFTFVTLLDLIAIPTAFTVACIRMGNFFNQEILGTSTTLPWGVIFGDPFDGSLPEPRHPVQLYEAGVYLLTFAILLTLWRKYADRLRTGVLIGLFFIMVFGSRIFLEFFKKPQSIMIDESFFQTGQYLSIPFVLAGIWLFFKGGSLYKARSLKTSLQKQKAEAK